MVNTNKFVLICPSVCDSILYQQKVATNFPGSEDIYS